MIQEFFLIPNPFTTSNHIRLLLYELGVCFKAFLVDYSAIGTVITYSKAFSYVASIGMQGNNMCNPTGI